MVTKKNYIFIIYVFIPTPFIVWKKCFICSEKFNYTTYRHFLFLKKIDLVISNKQKIMFL